MSSQAPKYVLSGYREVGRRPLPSPRIPGVGAAGESGLTLANCPGRIMLRTRNSKVTDEHESILSSNPDSSPPILLISDGSTHPTATCSTTSYNQVFGPVTPARSQRCPEKICRVLPNDVMIIPGFMLPDSTQSMQPGCSDRALRPITVATYPREGRYRSPQYHNRSIMRESARGTNGPKLSCFCRLRIRLPCPSVILRLSCPAPVLLLPIRYITSLSLTERFVRSC